MPVEWQNFMFVIDLFWIIDIFLNFRTA